MKDIESSLIRVYENLSRLVNDCEKSELGYSEKIVLLAESKGIIGAIVDIDSCEDYESEKPSTEKMFKTAYNMSAGFSEM